MCCLFQKMKFDINSQNNYRRMENETSASNMVLRQLNNNTSEITTDVHQSHHSRSSKHVIHVRSSHKKVPAMEQKSHLTKPGQSVSQNKQNQPYLIGHSKKASHAYLHNTPDEKKTHKRIEHSISSEKNQKSSSHKKRSVFLLQNIFQRETYTKRLMTYLPPGNYLLANVLREKSLLSTDVKLTVKGQEMIKAKKIGGCLTSDYEIMSENQRQNTLGFVKSNFSGSVFNVYETNDLNDQKLVATIWYEDSFSFQSGPRSVEMYLLHPEQSVDDLIMTGQGSNLKELCERGTDRKITKLKNKQAEWRQNGYCVEFGVSHVLPSIKNVILQKQPGNALIGLYKVRPDQFELIIRQGVSPFVAYCFALSSLTFKLACQ